MAADMDDLFYLRLRRRQRYAIAFTSYCRVLVTLCSTPPQTTSRRNRGKHAVSRLQRAI